MEESVLAFGGALRASFCSLLIASFTSEARKVIDGRYQTK